MKSESVQISEWKIHPAQHNPREAERYNLAGKCKQGQCHQCKAVAKHQKKKLLILFYDTHSKLELYFPAFKFPLFVQKVSH